MAEERLLTVNQVAERLQVHQMSVRRWIKGGRLPGVRVGTRTIRVREEDLDAFKRPANGRPAKV
jgi:excisionase family DNA binding protein